MNNLKCVFFGGEGLCRVLYTARASRVEIYQNGCEGCLFSKTREEYQQGQAKAFERINSLSEDKQLRIARAYYRGNMPWKTLTLRRAHEKSLQLEIDNNFDGH